MEYAEYKLPFFMIQVIFLWDTLYSYNVRDFSGIHVFFLIHIMASRTTTRRDFFLREGRKKERKEGKEGGREERRKEGREEGRKKTFFLFLPVTSSCSALTGSYYYNLLTYLNTIA